LIALSRYGLLLDIEAKLTPKYADEMRHLVEIDAVLGASPSCAWTLIN
jgi:hypothetical protein